MIEAKKNKGKNRLEEGTKIKNVKKKLKEMRKSTSKKSKRKKRQSRPGNPIIYHNIYE